MTWLKLLLLFFIVTIFSNCSITKRHFRAGYDVTWHHCQKSGDKIKESDKIPSWQLDSNLTEFSTNKVNDSLIISDDYNEFDLVKNSDLAVETENAEKYLGKTTTPMEKIFRDKGIVVHNEYLNNPRKRRLPLAASIILILPAIIVLGVVSLVAYFVGFLIGEVLFGESEDSSITTGAVFGILVATAALFFFLHLFDRKELKLYKTKLRRNITYAIIAFILAGFVMLSLYFWASNA